MNWIKEKSRTLFFKIFISFLSIIVVFGLFYAAIFHLFKTGLQQEIIKTSQRDVTDTAERFSNQFRRLQVLMLDISSQSELIGFNNELRHQSGNNVNYLKALQVIRQMRSDIYNPLFYLEDTLIYFHAHDVVLSKSGSGSASYMFNRSYASPEYGYSFWQGLDQNETFQLFPASMFQINNQLSEKNLLPFVYRHPDRYYSIIALMDIEQAAGSFFGQSGDRMLAIMDKEGQLLYSQGLLADSMPASIRAGQPEVVLQDNTYYFAQPLPEGLVFVSAVPYSHVTSQLSRLTGALTVMFFLSIGIALTASYLLSRRLHKPVKHILSTVLDRKSTASSPIIGGIAEYDLIQDRIQELLREKEEIREQMSKQQSVLTSYSYISQLKSINTDISEWVDFLSEDGSFNVVLYDIRFRMNPAYELPLQSEQAVRHILEHIHLITAEHSPKSHTFQIEKNEIISIYKREEAGKLEAMLEEIRAMLDREREVFLVTMAVSAEVSRSADFNGAYRQVKTMAGQARLLDETQLIMGLRTLPEAVHLSSAQEKGLHEALQSGSDVRSRQIIEQALEGLYKKEAGIDQFRMFADAAASKILGLVDMSRIDKSSVRTLKDWSGRLQECQTLDDYAGVFRQLIEAACALIRKKKDTGDEPLIAMFMNILHTQYAEDISLDYLSARLNLSSAYLSVYIKEKTGMNFSDHLLNIRMNKAKELLACTNLTVSEISQRVGYLNITSFNRMFKKATGMTPGAYRRQHLALTHAGS
ncbi:AraC family transcriptional regulator [Paenibacillus sp. 7541]|uniref:helix-turn-helix domain-containing protein n=1 Tax=Paenibacillus sp. 7541 TaxID=2026236 RepID=UPI000BA7154A|nr:AraC family transcriptional regulator [Paenibacillus sp. 7541]PAK54939.1 AraC family transcriptional regulator [Paenibacillus sp. 7541]